MLVKNLDRTINCPKLSKNIWRRAKNYKEAFYFFEYQRKIFVKDKMLAIFFLSKVRLCLGVLLIFLFFQSVNHVEINFQFFINTILDLFQE